MPVITLTTDLGLKDYYVASVKAAILNQCSEAIIVDISHLVPKFDILQAAFILRNTYSDFPEGTIHIVGVMPDKIKDRAYVAVAYNHQYFVGSDNGIIPLIIENRPDQIIELDAVRGAKNLTFPLKDILVKAACKLAKGNKPETLGKQKNELVERTGFHPVITENAIRGTVVYIDDFGNIFVNITEKLFHESVKGRKFLVSFRTGGYSIKTISKNYNDVPPGEMLAIFSTTGFLEIAINTGNASELLGIRLSDIILVDFI